MALNQTVHFGNNPWELTRSDLKITAGVRSVICILGIIGNLTVIFVVGVLQEYKKNNTHWYVLQLAIADALFLLTLPFKVHEELNNGWKFTSGMCKGKETILFLNYYASILFLVIMSVDRYIAVCHGFSKIFQKMRRQSFALIITAVIWAIAILLCVPIILYSDKRGQPPNCKCSYEFPTPPKTYEEHCIEEGFKDDMSTCLGIYEKQPPPSDINLCSDINVDKPTETTQANTTQSHNTDVNSTDYSYFEMAFWDYIGQITNNTANTTPNTNNTANTTPNTNNTANTTPNTNDATNTTPNTNDATNTTSQTTADSSDRSSLDYLNFFENWDYIEGVIKTHNTENNSVIDPQCHYFLSGKVWSGFLIFNFVGMFIIPLLVMAFCYCMIILKLQTSKVPASDSPVKKNSKLSSQGGSQHASYAKREQVRSRVTIMCAVLVSFFLVSWLPFHSMHMAKLKGINTRNTRLCVVLPVVVSICAYANSALNPFLYNFLSRGFLKRLRKAGYTIKLKFRKSFGTQSMKAIDKQARKNYAKSRSRGSNNAHSQHSEERTQNSKNERTFSNNITQTIRL